MRLNLNQVLFGTIIILLVMAGGLGAVTAEENDIYTIKLLNNNLSNPAISEIDAGMYHSLALAEDGTVWAWGAGGQGQLGDGEAEGRNEPAPVQGPEGEGYLENIVEVSAGKRHSLALKEDGTVWAWGWNERHELGDGTSENRYKPVQVHGPGGDGYLENVVEIATWRRHNLVIKEDGTVWAWGMNNRGQLGDGTNEDRSVPVQVLGPEGEGYLNNIKEIDAGHQHSLALKKDGTLWSWGGNWTGQLGDTTEEGRSKPVRVHAPVDEGYLDNIVEFSAGNFHTLALKEDGTVWGTGHNSHGQLSGTNPRTRAEQIRKSVPTRAGMPDEYLENIKDISAGSDFSMFLKEDGTVMALGLNNGNLGDGTNLDRTEAVQVRSEKDNDYLENVLKISAGGNHTLAMKEEKIVLSWGQNNYGQLGDGTTENQLTPVEVKFDPEALKEPEVPDEPEEPEEPKIPEEERPPSDILVFIDGELLVPDDPPVIEDGRTLAPMRAFFEALGAEVKWESETETAIGIRNETVVEIPIGSTEPTVNGEIEKIQVPAKIINGRTYIPLRFVGEALGDEVEWDGEERRIDITTTNSK